MSHWSNSAKEGNSREAVLDSGHVYTDETTLPLQNNDPARRSTVEAKL
jgi:hypothetical protein